MPFGFLILSFLLISVHIYGLRMHSALTTSRFITRYRTSTKDLILRNVYNRGSSLRLTSSSDSYNFDDENPPIVNPKNGDEMLTGLNGMQDISVRVVNCRELVQEAMLRSDLSPIAARGMAEVTACALMMGSNLKGKETLQIALVGNGGMKNIMAITNGQLQVRCRVGDNKYTLQGGEGEGGAGGAGFDMSNMNDIETQTYVGEVGQIQITRNHPTWKQPQCGIVQLNTKQSVPLNLSVYMGESEQRSAAMITDVEIEGTLCRRALGVMVEALPGATEQNIERVISNLEGIRNKGLKSYLSLQGIEWQQQGEFRDYFTALSKIVADCLENVELDEQGAMLELDQGISWSKYPIYKCSCGLERVWSVLALLPRSEVKSMIAEGIPAEIKCDFCGQSYSLGVEEMKKKFEEGKTKEDEEEQQEEEKDEEVK